MVYYKCLFLVLDLHLPTLTKKLYLKKAGLAGRNIVHLQKDPFTLCRLLLLFSSNKKAHFNVDINTFMKLTEISVLKLM